MGIIANVINPAGEVNAWVLFPPWYQGWGKYSLGKQRRLRASGWYSTINPKERGEFLLGTDCLGASVQLHRQFKMQWWVVQLGGLLLQLVQRNCVIES